MGNVHNVDRTLPSNEMIYYVRKDPELRRGWQQDFSGLASEYGLSGEEIEAVQTADVFQMNEMGVHQHLISQILRLNFGTGAVYDGHPAV